MQTLFDEAEETDVATQSRPAAGQLVVGVYRPRSGQATELSRLLLQHLPLLRAAGLAEERPWLVLRSADGCHVEMFAWKPGRADDARRDPEVAALTRAIRQASGYAALPGVPSSLSARFEAIAWEP